MKTLLIDIETSPRPEEEIIFPEFSAPKNYKDETKISEYIAAERVTFMEKAALSATTGYILAAGLRRDGVTKILDGDEKTMLKTLWSNIEGCVRDRRIIVGFNIERFDIPFMIRRSWFHNVQVPDGIISPYGTLDRQFFLDLMKEYACGNREDRIKMGDLAKFLGVGEKNGEGKNFHILWATERKLAIAYLENDLLLVARIMERMLGISEVHTPEVFTPPIQPILVPSSAAPNAPGAHLGGGNPLAQVKAAAPPPALAGSIDDY